MTDEDKTLLELAAKAAGIKYDPEASKPNPVSGAWFGLWLTYDREPTEYDRRRWNPLTDDGDALRLMVQLGFGIYRGHDAIRGEFCEISYWPRKYAREKSCIEYHKDHPNQFAATRRAIVRAAAEIGKAMQ